jgi:hypothetical protein
MSQTERLLAALMLFAMTSLSSAMAATDPAEAVDLIDDRPSVIATIFGATANVFSAIIDKAEDLISTVLPPSPTTLSKSSTGEDEQELMKLLGYAGYKLKEIDSQVGIVPTLAFKFALTRELSEADWDYLDYRLELSRFHTPGLGAAIQRTIVETVMAVNTGDSYQVSELKVQILPLPKVAFSVTPKVTTLGEESSALMRAIQKMEKRLRGDIAVVGGKVLPQGVLRNWIEYRNWLIGAAIVLFVISIVVELWRQLRAARLGRPGPLATLILLGLGMLCWVGFTLIPLSLITLAGGVAVFGLTALIVAGKEAVDPASPPVCAAPVAATPSEPIADTSAV